MRLSFALVLVLPAFVHAQPTPEQKKATVKWVAELQAPGGGFYATPHPPGLETKPIASLRATNAAVRSLKYLGAELPNREKHSAFVLSCFDEKTGGFAEPGGQADVGTTSVGVMAAIELGVPKEKFAKAMDYLKEKARTFEDVRIGAAAVEVWGVKACPFPLDPWFEIARKEFAMKQPLAARDGGARDMGSIAAMALRLGVDSPVKTGGAPFLIEGQLEDGGWRKKDAARSDLDTTYRVMRALMLFKRQPKDVKSLRGYLASHRNTDGGYGVKPGDTSTLTGVYYCTIVTKWLDDLDK
jgi:prenyltransferase beta subunit